MSESGHDKRLTVGVDVGGSFTDVVVSDGFETWRAKAPTNPGNFAIGVLEGCQKVAEEMGLALPQMILQVSRFGLGTTAVTNALTVHQGERVGLLTTRGFEHVPLMARGERVARDGWLDMPWVPLDIRRIGGVDERLGRGGEIIKDIRHDDVEAQLRRLVEEEQITALAISFLWSFVNPAHEDFAADVARQLYPDLPIFTGSSLQPVIREYERTMVAVMNAFCANALNGIESLDRQLRELGLSVPLLILQANGGATTLDGARSAPVSLAASGPAAGVAAAAEVALASGYENIACGDMGGTSFDVGIVTDGKPTRRQRGEIHGVKLAQAHVEVLSVGSGGGSIGWIDSRGLLRVGPRTARAYPGPACYGRGGTEPTVTDAMLLLGYLDGDKFLGGSMTLDRAAAEAACAEVGARIGLTAMETAWGIRELALADMVNAFRAHVSASGLDPRAVTGMTYGGSGSLFMAEICGRVGVGKLLAPELASVLSAYGAASADVRVEKIRAVGATAPFDLGGLQCVMDELAGEVNELLAERGIAEPRRRIVFEGDFRFERQSWEIPVELGDRFDEERASEEFLARYKRQYGDNSLAGGVALELVTLRAIGIGGTVRATLPVRDADPATPLRQAGTRSVHIDRGHVAHVDAYEASSVVPGHEIAGPALLDAIDNTLWIPPGATARMDERRTLHMELTSNG